MEPSILRQIKDVLRQNFDLRQEKEDEQETIESIKKGIEFKGATLWILIFAVFLASLGLNTNSTAVIIGAMLISPLMGPIMGFGLGLGISDFDLVKRSLRNFFIATLFSITTSTLFFYISPISEAQSELLARTSPTAYDVLIAFFGGLAGIVASSTKSKGNIIPGVAIATALMPPLCTVGFGIATGNFSYFGGALYLYLINSVFISVATYTVVRILRYPRVEILDKKREKKVRRYIAFLVFCTFAPSIYLTYNLFQSSLFEQRVRTFINQELDFSNTQILNRTITNTVDKKEIKVVLIGEKVPDLLITLAKDKLPSYKLEGTNLIIQQSFGGEATDINELKSLLMQDLYKNSEELLQNQAIQIDSLKRSLDTYKNSLEIAKTVLPELKVLFPYINEVSCSPAYIIGSEFSEVDTVMMVYIKSNKKILSEDNQKLLDWFSARTKQNNIKILIE